MKDDSESEFTGFGPGAVDFLRDLDRNNARPWFEANRERYERELRRPLVALVEEMDVRFAEFAPEITGHPRQSIFRIHRDVRFSNDKRPYKTNIAAWFPHQDGGRGVGSAAIVHGGAGFYFDIGPAGVSIGGGIWKPPRPTLTRIRRALFEDHEPLESIIADPVRRRRFGILAPEAMLRRMPRGYPAEHSAAELLRHQSFTMGRAFPELELWNPELPDLLAQDFALLLPLVRWLNATLGLKALKRR